MTTSAERTARHRHGVVVVHGQGADRTKGVFLASVANGIADTLEMEVYGGRVERAFDLGGTCARATIAVDPPEEAGGDARQYEFVEAFWDAAFPPAQVDIVYRWSLIEGWRQVRSTMQGWLSDPANDRRGMARTEAEAEAETGEDERLPLPAMVRTAYITQALLLRILLWVVFVLWLPVIGLLFVLNILANTPGLRLFGLWDRVAGAIQSLDPFLSKVMGDSQTYVEHGMWSASARGVLETATIEMLQDPGIESVTIIAHSAGCGLAYDALLEGRAIPQVLGEQGEPAVTAIRADGRRPTRLTLVTVGSAVNRYHWLSARGRTTFARRFVKRHLDGRVTGLAACPPSADGEPTEEEKRLMRERFFWLDIYARLDAVPAGPVRDAVVAQACVHPAQVKRRQVINLDNPVSDHGAYFSNSGLVVPRIIRSISGGAYPWELPEGASWTFEGARRRVARVAALQSVRLGLVLAGVLHIALLLGLTGYRDTFDRLRDWTAEQVARLPVVEAGSDPAETGATLLVVLASLLALLAVERVVHRSFFPDLSGG